MSEDLFKEWLACKTLEAQKEFAEAHGLHVTFISAQESENTDGKRSANTKKEEKNDDNSTIVKQD